MAKLTENDVLKLAELARLSLDEEEISQFQTEINQILTYVEQLADVDVSELTATSQVTGLTNKLRPDVIKAPAYDKETLFKNTPELTDEGYIKVRRMLT